MLDLLTFSVVVVLDFELVHIEAADSCSAVQVLHEGALANHVEGAGLSR